MHDSKNTHDAPKRTTDPHVTPVGGSGRVAVVSDDDVAYLVCRTVRGRGGWGVHTADGDLLVSGWPTKTRAVDYAGRLLQKRGAAA